MTLLEKVAVVQLALSSGTFVLLIVLVFFR
jgi:hypothetical protein